MPRAATVAIAALAALVLVAGCATTAPPPASPPFKPRAVAPTFSVSGRIAARDTGDAKRGFSGGFSWNHKPGEDVVELLTPLGQIAARVTMTPAGATIELADGQRATTTEPEAYVGRVLGINLPIAALPYWMQGAPVPSSPMRVEPDETGRVSTLWQHGWQIRYAEYADAGIDAHPTQIHLTQGDIEARMIIGEWNTP